MRQILYSLVLAFYIYKLIHAIVMFNKSGEKEMSKKIKSEIWWSILAIIVFGSALLAEI